MKKGLLFSLAVSIALSGPTKAGTSNDPPLLTTMLHDGCGAKANGVEPARYWVTFKPDKATIDKGQTAVLDGTMKEISSRLFAGSLCQVIIAGYTAPIGTPAYDLGLGGRLANAVKEYLVQKNIPSSLIKTISFGKEFSTGPKGARAEIVVN